MPSGLTIKCLSLPLPSLSVVFCTHSRIPFSLQSLLLFLNFSLSFHNVTSSDLSITLNIQHFLPLHTNIWGYAHPCHNDLLTKKSQWACGSPSWSLAWFMSSATHYTSTLSGLWMTCSPLYLAPAVVRSATQVWPQGLCLWKWLQLLFLVLNVPWRIKNQHSLLTQERTEPSSTTLPTNPS